MESRIQGQHNIIPLGDHCCASIIMRELGLRRHSYPFDWTVHEDELKASNIPLVVDLIETIVTQGSAESIIRHYIPRQPTREQIGKIATHNNVKFPHDKFWEPGMYYAEEAKYRRRSRRLLRDLLLKDNDYLIITRSYVMSQEELDRLAELLIAGRANSRIIYITGANRHIRLCTPDEKRVTILNVPFRPGIPYYIEYTERDYWEHDETYWRPTICRLLKSLYNQRPSKG